MLEYESGARCQPAMVMVLVESSWKVGAFGPPCGDLSFPKGASTATELSSAHELPTPADESETFEREVTESELKEEIGRGTSVLVEFVVDENGNISDLEPQLRRSFPPETSAKLDSAAVQAVRSVKFEPGRLNGEPVPTRMSVPVLFRPSTQ